MHFSCTLWRRVSEIDDQLGSTTIKETNWWTNTLFLHVGSGFETDAMKGKFFLSRRLLQAALTVNGQLIRLKLVIRLIINLLPHA